MNKKYIPLLLILILLVCITTGIIVYNKYLDDNKDVIDKDVPKLEIDTDEDTVIEEDIVENEEIEDNDQTDSVVDDSEKNDTTNNSSNNSTSNNTTNNNKPTKPTKPSNDNNSNKDNEDDKEEVVPTPPTQEQLNNEYRNIDKPTDVLSFPMFEKDEIKSLENLDLNNIFHKLGRYIDEQSGDLENKQNKLLVLDEYFRLLR